MKKAFGIEDKYISIMSRSHPEGLNLFTELSLPVQFRLVDPVPPLSSTLHDPGLESPARKEPIFPAGESNREASAARLLEENTHLCIT